ncbi:MAG: PAS domain S-box protein, partial [Candidatus Hydrogenedentes bacterium]|nr:PAS domain S-box protein [Candidatus Hydrogenedentota bacterium]
MAVEGNSSDHPIRVSRYVLVVAAMWAATVAGLLAWNILSVRYTIREAAQIEARAHFSKHMAFRAWANSHGGVYVPVDDRTPANPHLANVPERDIATPSGVKLTLMNPDYVIRQLLEESGPDYGVLAHITSLNPLRPENAPDAWERAALDAFQRGETEVSEFTEIRGEPYLRIMRPMIADASCLKCHQEKGFLEGGVIGGSSVSAPMGPLLAHGRYDIITLIWSYGLVGFLGLGGIGLASRHLRRRVRERNQAEREVRKSSEQLSLAIEGSGVGLWDWALPGGDTVFNERGAAMLGYALSELSPMSQRKWEQMCHPDDLLKSRALLQKHFAGATPYYECEERLRHKDGHWIWVLDRGRVTAWDAQGRPSRMTGTHLDITERKRAEDELRTSREQLSLAIEGSGVGLWDWMVKDGLTIINDRGAQMLGYALNELSPLSDERWEALCHPDDLKASRAALKKHFARETPYFEFEERLRHKDGRWVWVLDRGRVMEWDEEGRPARMTGTHLDITERKRSEQEYQRLISAIEQASEAVVITDVDAVIQYVNPAFERITGYTREEALGANPRILKSGKHDAAFYQEMWRTLSRGETWTGRVVNKRKDGSLYTDEGTLSPVRDASGQTVNYVAVKRDVTREITLEEQLYQSQRMEAIGQLAGGVAHDFNNLLQSILGYTDLILDDADLADRHRAELGEVHSAARRAAELTRQILAFSRRQVLQLSDLDLNEVVSGLVRMLRRTLREDISLDIIPGYRLGTVHADRGQLEQVLLNLCINAQDAMPQGGKISVETQNVVIDGEYCRDHSWAVEGRYVLLSVTDNGSGMDAETQHKIFEPFFTTKDVGKGTGLGLAMVYGIVKQHSGMIQVYSEINRGTMFKIYLPIVERPASAVGVRLAGPAPGGRETILLAEDDDNVRALATRILSDAGYTVLAARDGADALRVYGEHAAQVRLAILDIVMPGMGGREVQRVISEKNPQMRFLFSSGYSENAVHTNFVLHE